MSIFPNVLFFRYEKYNEIDIKLKSENVECTFYIISDKESLSLFLDKRYNILVTYGPDEREYINDVNSIIPNEMYTRWIHYTEIDDMNKVSKGINYCFTNTVLKEEKKEEKEEKEEKKMNKKEQKKEDKKLNKKEEKKESGSYPQVLFFRHDKYKMIDSNVKAKNLDCTFHIISEKESLSLLFDTNYPVLVTYGPDEKEYINDIKSVLPSRMFSRWIHYQDMTNMKEVCRGIQYCFIDTVLKDRKETRPIFSAFTTCYNSDEKIKRPFTSLKSQTLLDWEWVILDDSPGDEHFTYLRNLFKDDKRIRLYKRSENSGNIGNVKNEAVSLCRGIYVLELDHDDEIVPELFSVVSNGFKEHPDVGFVYTDFINIYENGDNYWYGDFFGLGYAAYYCQKYNGKWVNVYTSPQINNITMRHLVSLPNHPRIWKREVLHSIGNYSEYLPINDDQEILLQTCLQTKMMKIPMMGYIQYMNNGNSNFSLIRNKDINRIGPDYLTPQFYKKHSFQNVMREKDAHDNEKYMNFSERVWTRDSYNPSYANVLYQPKYDKQYCILSREVFIDRWSELLELSKNPKNDFFVMDSTGDFKGLCRFLDKYNFSHAKCYSIKDITVEQQIKYFEFIYRSCEESVIMK